MNTESPFIILRNHRKRQPLSELPSPIATDSKLNCVKEKPAYTFVSPIKNSEDK